MTGDEREALAVVSTTVQFMCLLALLGMYDCRRRNEAHTTWEAESCASNGHRVVIERDSTAFVAEGTVHCYRRAR